MRVVELGPEIEAGPEVGAIRWVVGRPSARLAIGHKLASRAGCAIGTKAVLAAAGPRLWAYAARGIALHE
ncbi:MAG TPA: hypothetical protein VM912_02435, partial [Terriglobales bacterium]|nr:hypothetical protein [Terriglobales bacterium]